LLYESYFLIQRKGALVTQGIPSGLPFLMAKILILLMEYYVSIKIEIIKLTGLKGLIRKVMRRQLGGTNQWIIILCQRLKSS
jgi:hypothetical protein